MKEITQQFTELTHGIRKGELVVMTAGSNVGRSQLWQCLKCDAYNAPSISCYRCGYIKP